MAKRQLFKKLYRSETNKVLAGVCGGLGEYFGVDPTIIRLIFVLITIFGGSGVLAYIILWILIPSESQISTNSEQTIKENAEELKQKARNFAENFRGIRYDNHPRNWFAFIIIVLGFMFLFENLGLLQFHLFWPILIIALGLFLLFK